MRIAPLSALKNSHFPMLAGQSNAAGYQYPADVNTYVPKEGQYIFENVSQTWQRLQQNFNNGGTYIDYTGSIGCEMHLMQLLKDYYGSDQYLFKYSAGGTSIDPTPNPPNYNWSPLSTGDPQMFKGFVSSLNNAVASFPVQPIKPKILIWIQGENDVDLARANAYATNFRTLIDAFKNACNLPDLKVLQTLLADTQTGLDATGKSIVNSAKINYSINGNRYVNIDGAEVSSSDNIHFTATGQNYIAQKIFDVLITML